MANILIPRTIVGYTVAVLLFIIFSWNCYTGDIDYRRKGPNLLEGDLPYDYRLLPKQSRSQMLGKFWLNAHFGLVLFSPDAAEIFSNSTSGDTKVFHVYNLNESASCDPAEIYIVAWLCGLTCSTSIGQPLINKCGWVFHNLKPELPGLFQLKLRLIHYAPSDEDFANCRNESGWELEGSPISSAPMFPLRTPHTKFYNPLGACCEFCSSTPDCEGWMATEPDFNGTSMQLSPVNHSRCILFNNFTRKRYLHAGGAFLLSGTRGRSVGRHLGCQFFYPIGDWEQGDVNPYCAHADDEIVSLAVVVKAQHAESEAVVLDKVWKTQQQLPLCKTWPQSGRWLRLPAHCDTRRNRTYSHFDENDGLCLAAYNDGKYAFAPWNCNLHFYSPRELQTCFQRKQIRKVVVEGDSLVQHIPMWIYLHLLAPGCKCLTPNCPLESSALKSTCSDPIAVQFQRSRGSSGVQSDASVIISDFSLVQRSWKEPFHKLKVEFEREMRAWENKSAEIVPVRQPIKIFLGLPNFISEREPHNNIHYSLRMEAFVVKLLTELGWHYTGWGNISMARSWDTSESWDGMHHYKSSSFSHLSIITNMICN